MTAFRIVPVVALVALSACATVAPVPALPDITNTVPAQFEQQETLNKINASANSGVSSLHWWEGFNDSTLNTLIETSLQANFQIAAATARVRESRAALRSSEAGDSLLIELDAQASAQTSDRASGNAVNGAQGSSNRDERLALLGLNATLPLDLAGRVDRDIDRAAAQLLARQAELRAAIIDTSTAVAQEYLRLRGNQKQLAMLKESLALQEKTLSIVRVRFESGLSPELDVRRAETSVENLRAAVPPLEQSLRDSRQRLATLAGQFPGAYDALLTPEAKLPQFSLSLPPALPLQVIQARPDVQLAQARFSQAAAEVGLARADFLPSINLMASVQIGSSTLNGNPAASVLVSALTGMLSQLVYDGGARSARLDAAQARAEAALADYEAVLRSASLSVENALSAIESSATRQEALKKAVESSKRSFQQADTLYQLGLVSFLDVVDAQRVFANAEQSLATEQTSYATLVAGLFRVLAVQA